MLEKGETFIRIATTDALKNINMMLLLAAKGREGDMRKHMWA